jgi:hypothetical protein
MRELRVVGAVEPAISARLADVTRLDTLEDVLHRGFEVLDVIVQDEYTHDVVCRTRDAFVVFDTT